MHVIDQNVFTVGYLVNKWLCDSLRNMFVFVSNIKMKKWLGSCLLFLLLMLADSCTGAVKKIKLSCSFSAGCRMFSQGRHQSEASGGCRQSGQEVTVLMEEERWASQAELYWRGSENSVGAPFSCLAPPVLLKLSTFCVEFCWEHVRSSG